MRCTTPRATGSRNSIQYLDLYYPDPPSSGWKAAPSHRRGARLLHPHRPFWQPGLRDRRSRRQGLGGELPALRWRCMWPPAASPCASPVNGSRPKVGLHQNWMRDYDPTTGRYIQADPLGLVDGASVYGYARQNPGRWTEPFGLTATCPPWPSQLPPRRQHSTEAALKPRAPAVATDTLHEPYADPTRSPRPFPHTIRCPAALSIRAISAIWAGVVSQQPPTIVAPIPTQRMAKSA